MSQRRSRRWVPETVGKRRRRTFLPARRFSEPRKASKLLKRCSSEPTLKTMISSEDLSLGSDGNRVFYRPQTCYGIFPSSLSIMDCSPKNQNALSGYSREAKVVVKVEVEGSPGPVRIMVKLGSSINDTIELVIHKYDEERRTPKIHLRAASSFELHSSCFSLQSLDKSAAIGDVGSRNFYLRKSNEETPVISYPPRPTSSPGSWSHANSLEIYFLCKLHNQSSCELYGGTSSNSLMFFFNRCSDRRSRGEKRKGRKMGEFLAWLISFFFLVSLLVIVIYQLMCLADLEFDHINPYDSSSRINKLILPEYISQGVLCIFYLLTGHWVMSLFCAPYLYYNVRLYTNRKHLMDVTEIFNQLNREKKQRLFKLVHISTLIFISIFWMIYTALEDDL